VPIKIRRISPTVTEWEITGNPPGWISIAELVAGPGAKLDAKPMTEAELDAMLKRTAEWLKTIPNRWDK
jgi:hypothetical protein